MLTSLCEQFQSLGNGSRDENVVDAARVNRGHWHLRMKCAFRGLHDCYPALLHKFGESGSTIGIESGQNHRNAGMLTLRK